LSILQIVTYNENKDFQARKENGRFPRQFSTSWQRITMTVRKIISSIFIFIALSLFGITAVVPPLLQRKRLSWITSSIVLLIALLFLRSPAPSYAQEGDNAEPSETQLQTLPANPKFEHLTSEQGLSNTRIVSILQDSQGFMWFGTQDGLNRYDGNEFRVFRHEPGNEKSLSANFVNVIFEDSDGILWLGLRGGLNRYDPKTESFIHYRHDPDDLDSLSNDIVFAISEDKDGNLWVGTAEGLDRFDPQLEEFAHYQHDPDDSTTLSHNAVRVILEDNEGILWIGTNGGGLNRFDPKKETFTAYRHNPDDSNTLAHDGINAMYQDDDGVFWLATWGGGLDRLEFEEEDPLAPRFTHYKNDPDDPSSLSHNSLYNIHEDESGGIWIGTLGGGLNRFDRHTEQFSRFQNNPDDPYSLNHNTILSMAGDRAGLLWLGTAGGGVNILDLEPKAFNHIYSIPGDTNSLSSNDVMGVHQDPDGVLWLGTGSGGLNKLDSEIQEVSYYQPDPDNPVSLSHNSVREVTQDSQGILWLATRRGVNRFDPATGESTTYLSDPDDPNSLLHNSIYTVREIEDGSILVGTSFGVNILDPVTNEISTYHQNEEIAEILSSSEPVLSIKEDAQGVLWIATGGSGLIQFDPQEEKITQYKHDPDDSSSLADNTIWNVLIDHLGTLWIGTSVGLDRFDRETGEFVHFNEKDGFPPGGVASILQDDLSEEAGGPNLWVSSSSGLTRFNPETGTIHTYDVTDGLQSNAFGWSSAFKNENGELFFGGSNGLTSFFPEQIQDNPNAPPLIITNLELDNQAVTIEADGILSQAASFTDQLTLPHDARVFSFEFSALNYRAPEKNRYRYMLEGFDEDWTEVGSDRRLVTYTNLDPGEYTFRVLGSNNDGIWNEEGASLAITITPPWWQTLWFRVVTIVSVSGLVAFVFLEQRRRRQAKEQELESLVETRTQELSFAHEQLESLFQNSTLAIGTAAMDGRVLTANEALKSILGYPGEEIFEANVMDFFADAEFRDELMAQLISEKIARAPMVHLKRKDGTIFYANITESILTRKDESVFLGIVDDITDQVMAEQELLKKAEETAVTEERERIARELHDSVTQTLYSASLIAEAVPKFWQQKPDEAAHDLDELRILTQGAQAEMRTLLLELRPNELVDRKLPELLRQLTDAMAARTELPISLTIAGECQVPPDVQIAYYRITQESLNNIHKHAKADRAWVVLKCEENSLTLHVGDNGRGFDPDMHKINHMGLPIMRERAEAIHADLTINTQLDQGTEVIVIWQPAE